MSDVCEQCGKSFDWEKLAPDERRLFTFPPQVEYSGRFCSMECYFDFRIAGLQYKVVIDSLLDDLGVDGELESCDAEECNPAFSLTQSAQKRDENEFDRRVERFWGGMKGLVIFALIILILWYGLSLYGNWQDENWDPNERPTNRYDDEELRDDGNWWGQREW